MVSRQISLCAALLLSSLLPAMAVADNCDSSELQTLFVGTQSGGVSGEVGRVFVYQGGSTWKDITPFDDPNWTVSAVMDLAYHNGHLYAGTQQRNGKTSAGGGGQVWRYEGGRTWVPIGDFDQSVPVLEVMDGKLYAVSDLMTVNRCEECDGSDWFDPPWTPPPDAFLTACRSGMASNLCGTNLLYLGELESDNIWHFNEADGLVQIQDMPGSCIWDFSVVTNNGGERHLYAGAYPSPGIGIFKSKFPQYPAGTCTLALDPLRNFDPVYGTSLYNWALEAFNPTGQQEMLYVGGGMGRMAGTCGAVTGAYMVLGLKADAAVAGDKDRRGTVYEVVREFARRFTDCNGSTTCKDLMGCDISTTEGLAFANEKGLLTTICPKMVQDAAEILEEML